MATDGYGFIDQSNASIRLRFERRLSRLPEVVWQAITDGDLLARWLFRAHFEPRAGGAMAFDYGNGRSQGTVLAWDEPTQLDYQWGDTPEQPTWRIRFLLSPSDVGALLAFEHLGPDPEDPQYAAGWHWHLDRLETLVDGGSPATVDSDEHFEDLLRHYRSQSSPPSEPVPEARGSASTSGTTLRRIAPVFVTKDLHRALRHYERLGFEVEAYDDAGSYGYAGRDGIEIHLATVAQVDCRTTTSCAYLWVDDADALYAEWAAAGVDGRLHPPGQTEYGLDEGAHSDPDGNLIRFGSPPVPPRSQR